MVLDRPRIKYHKLTEDIQIRLVRTRRKRSFLIKVANESVSVLMTELASENAAIKFAKSNLEFITKAIVRQKCQKPVRKRFKEGESLLFLGKSYKLKLLKKEPDRTQDKSGQIRISDNFLEVIVTTNDNNASAEESIRSRILDWYHEQAAQILTNRTRYYYELMNHPHISNQKAQRSERTHESHELVSHVTYKTSLHTAPKVDQHIPSIRKIRISDYKSKWGSCSSKNKISYNWRIILADQKIIDYLIVHELAHIKFKNHSKQFWDEVGKFCSEYKEARKWLRQNARMLVV